MLRLWTKLTFLVLRVSLYLHCHHLCMSSYCYKYFKSRVNTMERDTYSLRRVKQKQRMTKLKVKACEGTAFRFSKALCNSVTACRYLRYVDDLFNNKQYCVSCSVRKKVLKFNVAQELIEGAILIKK